MLKEILTRCSTSSGSLNSKRLTEDDKKILSQSFPFAKSIKEQFYCLKNNINEPPGCLKCSTPVKFHGHYHKYCSTTCARTSEETINLRRQTNLTRYGTTNALNNSDLRKEWEDRLESLYGTGIRNPACIPSSKEKISGSLKMQFNDPETKNSIIDKRRDTSLRKYGKKSFSQTDEWKTQTIDTTTERYGVRHYSQTDEWKTKFKETCLEKYGEENPFMVSGIREQIKKKSLEKYGVENPGSAEYAREKAKTTSWAKYGRPYFAQSHISDEMWHISQSKELTQKLHNEVGIYEIRKKYDVTIPWWISILKFHNIEINQARSYLESDFKKFLLSLDSISVKTNDRMILKGKEIDFLIDNNLGIELNGLYWHSECQGKDRNYHKNKTDDAIKANIRLIQIFEDEWLEKRNICESRVKSALGISTRLHARKGLVRPISSKEKSIFLSNNHIQGDDKSSIHLGLLFDNEIKGVMTFGKSRFNSNYEYELLRFCSETSYNIRGGASKLFSYFVNNYQPSSVISYCDRRWGEGETYKHIGMNFLHTSKPNYYYISDRVKRESRQVYQKHKLDKLAIFDKNLSEWENMKINGYDRIWDCGNNVYVWKRPI